MKIGVLSGFGAVAVAIGLSLNGCGPLAGQSKQAAAPVREIAFSILSAENQATTEPQWAPLLSEMSRATGVNVRPFFASNYTALIEAMRADQVQVGWFSALPALQAVNRSNADVLGRFPDAGSDVGYRSILIVHRGSTIGLREVLACGRRHSFGIGDAQSTSGTLAPMTYLFSPNGITPATCFSVVRSASHQANLFAVANGVIDIATSNSIEVSRAARENPALAAGVQTIWQSPPLPSSSIVVRRDMDPALRERIRTFLMAYGTGQGPEADRQRRILQNLSFQPFRAADNHYLDPVRLMQASAALSQAEHGSDAAAIAQARAAVDAVRREIAAHGET